MINPEQLERIGSGAGFVAALDQSGGSTSKMLAAYGIPETAYNDDAEMFDLVHQMRARIMTSPPFDRDRILAPSSSKTPWIASSMGRRRLSICGGSKGSSPS